MRAGAPSWSEFRRYMDHCGQELGWEEGRTAPAPFLVTAWSGGKEK